MKKIYVCLLSAIIALTVLSTAPCFALNLEETDDWNQLITSNYKDGFMTIDTEGDRIKISGVFKNDYPKKISIMGADASEEHLRAENDGTFSGELVCTPFENSYYHLRITFNSRLIYVYTLKYNDGWSVPDNGIAEANEKKLQNITSAPPIAAAYYLSAEGNRDEAEETLSELKRIVGEVCGDEKDDYVKAMKLIDWVGANISYDHDAAENSVTMDTVAIHNVLERRRTTCAGFANTFSALLEIAGIRSVNLKGAAVAGEVTYEELPVGTENHEFSAFWYEAEKRWVYCDACWTSNSSYRDGNYKWEISGGTKHFDVTGEAFALNHRIDKVEERSYTKALAALDGELSGTAAEKEESHVTESETREGEQTTAKGASAPKNDYESTFDKKENNGENLTPYIIIGLTGVMVIGAGIILDVNKNKRN